MKHLSQKQIMILWCMTLVLLSLFGCAGQKPDSGPLADRPETTAAPGENWSLSLPQITDEIIRESLTQEKDVLLNGLYTANRWLRSKKSWENRIRSSEISIYATTATCRSPTAQLKRDGWWKVSVWAANMSRKRRLALRRVTAERPSRGK